MGRTGLLWAHEAFGVAPDMMTVAKPLAGKSSADTNILTCFFVVTHTMNAFSVKAKSAGMREQECQTWGRMRGKRASRVEIGRLFFSGDRWRIVSHTLKLTWSELHE